MFLSSSVLSLRGFSQSWDYWLQEELCDDLSLFSRFTSWIVVSRRSAKLMVRLLTRLFRLARPDVPDRVVEVETALLRGDVLHFLICLARWVRYSRFDTSCATYALNFCTIVSKFEWLLKGTLSGCWLVACVAQSSFAASTILVASYVFFRRDECSLACIISLFEHWVEQWVDAVAHRPVSGRQVVSSCSCTQRCFQVE